MISEELKRLNKEGLKELFFPGYKINKLLTTGFFCLGVLLVFMLLQFEGNFTLEDNFYLSCEGSQPCINPFYSSMPKDCPGAVDCSKEYLQPGEFIGKPPSKTFKIAPLMIAIFTVFGLLINHIIYNPKYDFKERFKKISEKINEAEF